ncbi:hypothetical protein PR048_002829 [Dryococelus australis]|uniref:Uncharacterized protein n=1 Tax=Dryococelus australis TaxID=614101 RepID=A0ABQ9ILC7_9NEOP|nr:hypothetical protein PR048_002829 [Dryococelus australis]
MDRAVEVDRSGKGLRVDEAGLGGLMVSPCSYKHVFDGLWRIYHAEGMRGLFAGATTATGRSVLMTVGQLSFYDQIKTFLLAHTSLTDNVTTHFVTSTLAGNLNPQATNQGNYARPEV